MKRNGAPFLWNGCAVLAEYAKVYKPKRYLVVGRRNDFECDEWIEIKSDYTDVEIVTYDDLVDTVVSQFYQ